MHVRKIIACFSRADQKRTTVLAGRTDWRAGKGGEFGGAHDGQNRGGKPDGFCQKEARMFSGMEKIRASLRGTFYGNAGGVSVKTTQTGVQGATSLPVSKGGAFAQSPDACVR